MARYGLPDTPLSPRYGWNNGSNNPSWAQNLYGIGRFIWQGGATVVRDNPANPNPSSGFTGGPNLTLPRIPSSSVPSGYYIKTPRMVKASDGTFRLYCDCNVRGGNTWTLRLLTATSETGTFTDQGNLTGTLSRGNDQFPIVVEDPTDIPSRRWKMWYAGGASGTWGSTDTYPTHDHVIRYAYSADGITWTDFGVVINPPNGGWEYNSSSGYRRYMVPGHALKVDDEWFLFYGTRYAGPPGTSAFGWHPGLARFTNPESTYTDRTHLTELDGSNYYTKTTTLTASTSVGATSITVANASHYAVGDPLYIGQGSTGQFNVDLRNIQSIAGNTITLTQAMTRAHASGDPVSHGMQGSNIASFVWYDPASDLWRMFITAFQVDNAIAYEDGMHATATDPEGPWSYVMDVSPALPRVDQAQWDGISGENLAMWVDSTDPAWSMIYETGTSLTLGASSTWTQSGTTITANDTQVGVRSTVTATATSALGGRVVLSGAYASRFEVSLDGATWSSSVVIPAGVTTIYLGVTRQSGDPTLTAKVGVPL